ncbi:hypothetical protein KCP69_06000 [Salmonella enterica subsp. enterica]|nr:hypothetical protein KCP69_06000 [Salmonella enterica subsp. enterica]
MVGQRHGYLNKAIRRDESMGQSAVIWSICATSAFPLAKRCIFDNLTVPREKDPRGDHVGPSGISKTTLLR